MFGLVESAQFKLHEKNLELAINFAESSVNNAFEMGVCFAEINAEISEFYAIDILNNLNQISTLSSNYANTISKFLAKNGASYKKKNDIIHKYYCYDIFSTIINFQNLESRSPKLSGRIYLYLEKALSLITYCLEANPKPRLSADAEAKNDSIVSDEKRTGELLSELCLRPTHYGVEVIQLSLQSGYSPAETASHCAIVTIARQIRGTKDPGVLVKTVILGVAIAEHLKTWRDHGLMREAIWKNDSNALAVMIKPSPQSLPQAENVLADPISSKEKLCDITASGWKSSF